MSVGHADTKRAKVQQQRAAGPSAAIPFPAVAAQQLVGGVAATGRVAAQKKKKSAVLLGVITLQLADWAGRNNDVCGRLYRAFLSLENTAEKQQTSASNASSKRRSSRGGESTEEEVLFTAVHTFLVDAVRYPPYLVALQAIVAALGLPPTRITPVLLDTPLVQAVHDLCGWFVAVVD